MQRHHATHVYCPNPQCPHLKKQQESNSYHTVYSVASNGSSGPELCPHCETALRSSCPHCHRALRARPSNFCPACGGSLNAPAAPHNEEIHCQVCGRRMYGKSHTGVPLCSEECISVFIKKNIRVCDQCGQRFNSQEKPSECFTNFSVNEDENGELDFCSRSCMENYLENHEE